jgi:hypothetical protein
VTSAAAKLTKTLPPRRAAFVSEYLVDLNASRAARDVGYAAKSASVEGSRLLANADVQAEITRLRAVLAEQENVTPEKITHELAAIGFADMGDYIRIGRDGLPVLDLGDVGPAKLRAVASIKTDAKGNVSFKLQGDGVNLTINAHDSAKLAVLSTDDLRRALDEGVFDNRADTDAEEAECPRLREVRTSSESDE